MEIRLISRLTAEQLKTAAMLYVSAGWAEDETVCAFISTALAGSFIAAGAFEGEELLALGRVLSDGVSDAYIQDVVVHPAFRGRGIGGKLVRFLTEELENRGIDWIALVGEPGTEPFYKGLGFEAHEDFTLWKWKNRL